MEAELGKGSRSRGSARHQDCAQLLLMMVRLKTAEEEEEEEEVN